MAIYQSLKKHFIKSPQFYLLSFTILFHLLSMAFIVEPLYADATQFNDEAINIVSGLGWINTEGTGNATTTYPTQVLFLVLCKLLFGTHNYFFPVLLQHLTIVLSAYLMYKTCRLVNLNHKMSLLAEVILILFPKLYQTPNVLNTQTLGFFLPVLFLYFSIRYKSFFMASITGLTLGLAILARFTYQYVPFVLLISAFLFRNSKDYSTMLQGKKLILLLTVCLLTVAPWFYWVSSSNGGESGYSDAWNMVYKFNVAPNREFEEVDLFRRSVRDSDLTKAEQEAYYRRLSFELLREQPINFVKNIMTNTSAMLVHTSWQERNIVSPYISIYLSMLLGYSIVGAILLGKSKHIKLMPLYICSVITYIIHASVYGYIEHFYIFWFAIIPSISLGLWRSFSNTLVKNTPSE